MLLLYWWHKAWPKMFCCEWWMGYYYGQKLLPTEFQLELHYLMYSLTILICNVKLFEIECNGLKLSQFFSSRSISSSSFRISICSNYCSTISRCAIDIGFLLPLISAHKLFYSMSFFIENYIMKCIRDLIKWKYFWKQLLTTPENG